MKTEVVFAAVHPTIGPRRWIRGWVLAAALGVPVTAWAQVPARPTLRESGVIGGAGVSSLSGVDGATSVPAFGGGLYLTPNPNTLTWQVEGLLTYLGATSEGVTVRFLNIDVPLLARLNLRTTRPTRLHILVGGSAGYRLKASLESDTESGDITSLTESLEFKLVLGGGVTFGRVGASVRFLHGLNPTGLVFDGGSTRTRAVLAVVTVRMQ